MAKSNGAATQTQSIGAKKRMVQTPAAAKSAVARRGRTVAVPARSRAVAKKSTAAQRTRSGTAASGSAKLREKANAAIPATPHAKTGTAIDAQVLAHALNSLLHTMQVVQQHEEALCSLMHALRRGRASASLLRDLRITLDELPTHAYQAEVESLREAVAG